MLMALVPVAGIAIALAIPGCADPGGEEGGDDAEGDARSDGAVRIDVDSTGSLQNPAFSPEGDRILLTVFREGYNEGPADLLIADADGHDVRVLVSDGSENVNLPGSAWSAARGEIVFSSSREPHDEIYVIGEDADPGDEERVTDRAMNASYEPSFSPDGEWIVFERHPIDVEGEGVIVRCRADDGEDCVELSPEGGDCRQPNWSPAGERIVFQCLDDGRWDLWTVRAGGEDLARITSGPGDCTDASFSPGGDRIVFSSDRGELPNANLFIVQADGSGWSRLTVFDGYDGAPSWSPDGEWIAFESSSGDSDGSAGTSIWAIQVS